MVSGSVTVWQASRPSGLRVYGARIFLNLEDTKTGVAGLYNERLKA